MFNAKRHKLIASLSLVQCERDNPTPSRCQHDYHIWKNSLRLNSHLRFFRRELLRELFSPRNRKKWVDNPLLNFSVHAIVDQIAGVNVPI